MRKINVILILSLIISSCDQNEFKSSSKETKSRGKRELREKQVEVKKPAEEELREKLNDDESKGLNFLKEALGDNSKLNQILSLDESKVKSSLKHINDELAKCSGDNASQQKETFKTLVKAYFESNNNLDNIVGENSQLTSTCGSSGG